MISELWSVTDKFFVILDHFFPFNPLKIQKIKSLKNEKTIWRCHHFTHKYQKSQSNNACFLRYGVWQTYFFPFRSFSALLPHYWPWELKLGKNVKQAWRFYPFTHVYHKWRSYDLWFLRYKAWQPVLCHFGIFFAFHPNNNPQKQNFEKMKKTPGDIIILHLCTTNYNHIMYHSFGAWKTKLFVKKMSDISLHMCSIIENHMMYGSWDKECDRKSFFSFYIIFCTLPP